MTYKKYLYALLLITLFLLSGVGIINYIMDPACIYHSINYRKNNSPKVYAADLLTSTHGLLWPNNSWNERDIKMALAQQVKDCDCAIIGSSHVMNISSFRKDKSLTSICDSLINLGVSGGTLEDYLALTWELTNNQSAPRTIVFGVDYWALSDRQDQRWERYKESYQSMREALMNGISKQEENKSSNWEYLQNLINPDYFYRSLKKLVRKGLVIQEAPDFDYSVGINVPVILPDGSLIYSQDYIKRSNENPIPIGGSRYKEKLSGLQYSERGVEFFSSLIRYLRARGINIVILMTPYHHNVWADEQSLTTKALLEIESLIRKLGHELDISVIGSYNPDVVGCEPEEFYDDMHPKPSCLSKLH